MGILVATLREPEPERIKPITMNHLKIIRLSK